MKPANLFFLFALFPLIPGSATLAYGIVLSGAILWYFFTGILCKRLVILMEIGSAGTIAELTCLAASASMYLGLLRFIAPFFAVALSFQVILSAFAFVLLVSIDRFPGIRAVYAPVIRFIPFYLFFSAFRELLAFGSLSLPTRDGIWSIPILPSFEYYRLGFWGTTGGALILLGFITWFAKFMNRRVAAYRRNAQ